MRILIVTDYYREHVENGAEVFCSSLIDVLHRSHSIEVLTRASLPHLQGSRAVRWLLEDRLVNDLEELIVFLHSEIDLPSFDLVYNLGGLMFGCRVVQALRALWPSFRVINHFQALLGPYAAAEGLSKSEQDAHAASQHLAAADAALNIFISRGELTAAAESGMALSAHSTRFIPNGLAFDNYDRIPRDRSAMGTGRADDLLIVTGGRFSDAVKGADLLYRAFALLAAENPRVHLLSISNSTRFSYLLEAVSPDRWKIERWVPRSRFLEMLAGADLVVLPSRYEPFGLIALEALSLGVPVLANAVGGLADTVQHGVCGALNPLREGSYGLFVAMRQLLADRARLRELGRAGRAFVREEYSIRRVAGEVDAALHAACLMNASAN